MDHRAPKAIRFGLTVSLILAAALGSGCDQSGPGTPGDLTTTNDTVNGVIRVTNSGTAPEWRLTPVVSIGPKTLLVGDGGPEEFAEVRSAALGPDNEVFIADGDNAEVRVFGLDGEHRHTFGRHGEGPGEFSDITSLAWVGDRLLTLDLIGGRIGEFSADGETLGQRQAPGRWGGGMALRFYPVGADEAYSVSHVADATGMTVVFVGQTSAGETGDTLPVREDPWEQGITCEYNEGWISFFEIIYSPKLVQHPGPGGVMYQARTDMYRIAVTRGADTLRIIERTLPAEGVTDGEWTSATEEFRTFLDETPGADCDPRRPDRPATKPFINEIFLAPDGRLWVEVIRTAGNMWEVFDPEGRLLAKLPLHEWKERSVPAFSPDHMITIRLDSLDLDHVDVWRIDRGGG